VCKECTKLEAKLTAAQARNAALEARAPRQVQDAVNRFLGWKLPEDFAPDCGISFKREGDYEHPQWGRAKFEPVGTNLLTATQAKAMFEHCLYAPSDTSALDAVVEKAKRDALEEAAERALQTDYSLYSGPRQDALLRQAILHRAAGLREGEEGEKK
jgi:hypothetical protein